MLYLVNNLNFLVRNLDHVFEAMVCTPEAFWTQKQLIWALLSDMWEWWANQCSGRRLGLEAENIYPQFSSLGRSVKFMFSLVSQSCPTLQLREPQHARPPCPSLTPRVYSNSYPSSRWCHPTISSSVVPFSSYLQSFPASGSFSNESALHIRWPEYWSFSFSISPSNEHPGLISFRMEGWISSQSKGLSRVFSSTTVQNYQFFRTQLSL